MLSAATPVWELVVLQTVMMVGLSMMFTPLMTDALSALPDRLYSHGSAIMTTLQQVAGAAGTCIVRRTVMAKASASGGAPDMPGVHAAFVAAALIGAGRALPGVLHRTAAASRRRDSDALALPRSKRGVGRRPARAGRRHRGGPECDPTAVAPGCRWSSSRPRCGRRARINMVPRPRPGFGAIEGSFTCQRPSSVIHDRQRGQFRIMLGVGMHQPPAAASPGRRVRRRWPAPR